MAGLKKTKKQAKRKSINRRTKRNVKTIKKYTRKQRQKKHNKKLVGGFIFGDIVDKLILTPVLSDIPMTEYEIDDIEQHITASMGETPPVLSNNYESLFSFTNEHLIEEIREIVIENPLLFLTNYKRIINNELIPIEYDSSEFNYLFSNFLTEFYEDDYNVYDNYLIDFNGYSDETVYYLCLSHLCYMSKELIKNRLMQICDSFTTDDSVPAELKEYPLYITNVINDNYLICDETGEMCGFNKNKINIHHQDKFDNMHELLSYNIDYLQYTIENPDILTFDIIKKQKYDFTLRLASFEISNCINELTKCLDGTSISPICHIDGLLFEKLYDNFNNTSRLFEMFYNYIETVLQNVSPDLVQYNLDEEGELFKSWILDFGTALTAYKDNAYLYDGLKSDLLDALNNKLGMDLSEDYVNQIYGYIFGIIAIEEQEQLYPIQDSQMGQPDDILQMVPTPIDDQIFGKETPDTIIEYSEPDQTTNVSNLGYQQNNPIKTANANQPELHNRMNQYKHSGKTLASLRELRRTEELKHIKEEKEKRMDERRGLYVENYPISVGGGDNEKPLIRGHPAYDNGHDFKYSLTRQKCEDNCMYTMVPALDSIRLYYDYSGRWVEGAEASTKEQMKEIIKEKFNVKVCEKTFNMGEPGVIEKIQSYIKTDILNINKQQDMRINSYYETNHATLFYYDEGGRFSQIMFNNKLPKTSTTDSKVKKIDIFQQSSLLKAWDSSSGGRIVGNLALRNKMQTIQDPSERLNALNMLTIAFNIHSFMSMSHYFETFKPDIENLFYNGANAVVPILQTNTIAFKPQINSKGERAGPDELEFTIYVEFIKISDCINIRNNIITAQNSFNDVNDIISVLLKGDISKGILPIIDSANGNTIGIKTTAKTYAQAVMNYDTNAKYSVNAILTAVGLPKNDSRSLGTKDDSMKLLETFFNNLPAFKSKTQKISYGFMLKHSGDQCQGYQTQPVNTNIYEKVLNLVTGNKEPVKHILYTEDIFAFCNAVYNDSNVFTISVAGDYLVVQHSPAGEIEITKTTIDEMFAIKNSLDTFYASIKDADQQQVYMKNNEQYNKLIMDASNSMLDKDSKIELVIKFKQFNQYLSDMNFLKTMSEITVGNREFRRFPNEIEGIIKFFKIDAACVDVTKKTDNSILNINKLNKLLQKKFEFSVYRINVNAPLSKNEDTRPSYIFKTINNLNVGDSYFKEFEKKIFNTDNNKGTSCLNDTKAYFTSINNNFKKIQEKVSLIKQNFDVYRLLNTKETIYAVNSLNESLINSHTECTNALKYIKTGNYDKTIIDVTGNYKSTIDDYNDIIIKSINGTFTYDFKITSPMFYSLMNNGLKDKFTSDHNTYLTNEIDTIKNIITEIETNYKMINGMLTELNQQF